MIFGPGEGVQYFARGSTMVFKARGADTDGAFSFMEREMPPGGRKTPPHAHPGAEGFYVLDGTLDFWLGNEVVRGEAGCFVLVPAGQLHTFGNTSEEVARVLIIHTPAADEYFAELQALWSGAQPPDPEAERALQRRFGWQTG